VCKDKDNNLYYYFTRLEKSLENLNKYFNKCQIHTVLKIEGSGKRSSSSGGKN
jgi:hypothetical protein